MRWVLKSWAPPQLPLGLSLAMVSKILAYDEIEQAEELALRPNKGSLQAIGILIAILGVLSLAVLGLTLTSGGLSALLSIMSKSSFSIAFALIFVSKIGDKIFLGALLFLTQLDILSPLNAQVLL